MDLRVATLNVWALPMSIAERVPARMRAIGRNLISLELDIIALQEVWTESARAILIDAGRRAGLVHVWHNDLALSGSGLLVLSRLPIRSVRFEPFAIRGIPQGVTHIDFIGRKGFAHLRFDTPDGPFTLINTHLHARYPLDVSHGYRPHRTGQIVQLAMRARETADPLLALGDFNIEDSSPEYRILLGLTGLRDVAAQLGVRQPTVLRDNPYRNSEMPDRRIDLILRRDGARSRLRARSVRRVFDETFEIDGRTASFSDHAGVLADLELSGAAPARDDGVDREAVRMAALLLREGRENAEKRQRGDRAWAGVGLGGAILAGLGTRTPPVTRRRLLRGLLTAVGLMALTPGVGLSILSEVLVPNEINAFKALAERLEELSHDTDARVFVEDLGLPEREKVGEARSDTGRTLLARLLGRGSTGSS